MSGMDDVIAEFAAARNRATNTDDWVVYRCCEHCDRTEMDTHEYPCAIPGEDDCPGRLPVHHDR